MWRRTTKWSTPRSATRLNWTQLLFWYFWYLTATSLQEFRGMALQSHGPQQAGRPWIGLEHTNKVGISLHLLLFTLFLQANKRSRYTYMEKSIKIYNWGLVIDFDRLLQLLSLTPSRWTPSSVRAKWTKTSESFRLKKVKKTPRATADGREVPCSFPLLDCSKCIFLLSSSIGERFIYWSILIYWLVCIGLMQTFMYPIPASPK